MSGIRVWKRLLGVERTVIEAVELATEESGEEIVLARVRATARARSRCSRCGRRCRGYDQGNGRRRWRTLDLGTVRCYLEADAPRVSCREHGVVVAAVPWARAGTLTGPHQPAGVPPPPGSRSRKLLAGWLAWAKRSRLPAFVTLAKTIDRYRPLIWNTLDHELSNARSEATNTHLRVLTRRSYGFHTPEALIAMAMLTRGGLCPALPGRTP